MVNEMRFEINVDVAKPDITPEQVARWIKAILEQASQPGTPGHYFTIQAIEIVR